MDGHERARRQHRSLDTLLAAVLARTLAMSEKFLSSGLYTALLAPMGSGSPTCAITTPISPAGTCTHGNLRDVEHRPELETQPRHQQRGLVAGLAAERDGVVLVELAEREALGDEPDLGGADGVKRLPHQEQQQRYRHDDDDDLDTHGLLPFLGWSEAYRQARRRRLCTVTGRGMQLVPMSELELLAEYEPIVRLNLGELFFPTAVEDYVACCDLMERVAGQAPRVVVPRGELTLERLAEVGAAHPGTGMYLRLVDEPFSRAKTTMWRHRSERPRFRHASRLARVGVLSRVVDALNRISLLFRGKVAKGTEAAAEVLYRERMRTDHHPYYGRVVRAGGYVALQYWFFYPFNDWRSRIYGVNDHEADWEQVVVYLAEQPERSSASGVGRLLRARRDG